MVQKDVVAVRQHKLDVAQRVLWTGALAYAQLAAEHSIQVLIGQCGGHLAIGANEFKTLPLKICRVAPQPGHGFAAGDGRRNVPVRAEFNEAHVFVKQRGAPVPRCANDDVHGQLYEGLCVLPFVSTQHKFGNVDHDHARRLLQRSPAQAFHGQPDLLNPLGRGDGQLRQRVFAQHAISGQRMALLKGLDPVLQDAVIGWGRLRVVRQIAQRHQAFRELRQAGPGLPQCEFPLGQCGRWIGPGGMPDQATVLRERVAQVGIQRQERCSRAHRLGKLRAVQCRVQIGHWIKALEGLHRKVGMDLAWIDAA